MHPTQEELTPPEDGQRPPRSPLLMLQVVYKEDGALVARSPVIQLQAEGCTKSELRRAVAEGVRRIFGYARPEILVRLHYPGGSVEQFIVGIRWH